MKNALWHLKLGHVVDNRFRLLCTMFPFILYSKIDPCDICHLARQKKLSFSSCETHTNNAFYLIHVDIRGPYSTTFILGDSFS